MDNSLPTLQAHSTAERIKTKRHATIMLTSLFHVPAVVFLLAAAVPSLALDIPTMKELIIKEYETLHPYHVPSIMSLWADDGTFCIESKCYNGQKELEEVMEKFDFIESFSCDIKDLRNCFYLPNINKAACRFTCFVNLMDNPSCISDAWHGIRTLEWNVFGELIRIDEFFSEDDVNIALAGCMPDKKTDEMKPSKEM
jgi:hypothetical protein